MSELRATKIGNRISLKSEPAIDLCDTVKLDTRKSLFASANAIAGSSTAKIEDPLWRLEIAKLISTDGFTVIGQARQVVDTLTSQPVVQFSDVVDAQRVRFAASQLLNREGIRTREWQWLRAFAAFRYLASCFIAYIIWIYTVFLNCFGDKFSARDDHGVLLAVHDEISNRTRHVLSASVAKSCQGIILLGRPKHSLKKLAKEIASEFDLSNVPLVRPFDLMSAFSSVGRLARQFRSGAGMSAVTGYKMAWRDEVSMLYRMCLGAAAAEWWRHVQGQPRMVIFGHTGLADTSMLEIAMQAAGSKTIHWAHGLSGGWNYAGHSDLGLFTCGHDADVHAKLPAYCEVEYLHRTMPVYRPGNGKKWLLLTNYAHLTNPFFGHGALAMEAGIVRMAADATRRVGNTTDNLEWRPHPVFWQLPQDARDTVLADVEAAGCKLPDPSSPMPDFEEFSIIMCTPSTAALDVLVSGRLPVIVSGHELAPETAYSVFVLAATDVDQLVQAVLRQSEQAEAAEIFKQTWHKVRPGAQSVSTEMLDEKIAGLTRPRIS